MPSASVPTTHPRRTRRVVMSIVAVMVGATSVCGSVSPAVRAAPVELVAPVNLRSLASFGALTPAAFTSSGVTVFRGDVGGATVTFTDPSTHASGSVYTGAEIAGFLADLDLAYADAAGRLDGTLLPAAMGGVTVGPGVHTNAAAGGMAAGGVFTIDGQGDAAAVFIFQIGGALALGADTHVALTGKAQAKNVFWQVNGAPSIGAGSDFVGTVLGNGAVTSADGNTVNGRLLTKTGAISVIGTDLYSAPPTITIDGGSPASSTVPNPTISGVTSVRAPSTVTVTIDGVDDPVRPVPVASGAWTFTPSELLSNGVHTIVASVTDGAGNVGTSTQMLTVDTTPPVVTIDGGDPAATNDLTPTITGTSDVAAGQLVSLTMARTTPAATLTRTSVVQADHTWNISPNGLTPGEWTITAGVTDPAGNTNTATQVLTIDADAPPASITSNSLTNDPTPTIAGTAEVGAIVTVSIDGVAVGGVATNGADWSATAGVALGHGNHTVTVTATDPVGNTTSLSQTLDVDLIAPVIAINPGATDSTNDTTPTIAGTADVAVGVTVNVSIQGAAPLAALVQVDGWNVTPSAGLTAGDHTLVATVADPAGNIGSATQTLTIDTDAPTVIIDGGSSRTTRDATPTITGASPDTPVGSPVTVELDDQSLSTTIGTNGTYSVTAAPITPNGTYFVFVTVTDESGNEGDANQSLTINAIPPTVAYVDGATASTNDATPLIRGTTNAVVGSLVVVDAGSQTLHATVQPGGSWNVTAANLADGSITVTTRITDPDGNVGTATQTLTINSSAPTTVTIAGGATAATNDDTPTISGTTDAADGRVVTVTVAGQTLTTSADLGAWSVTAAHVVDGTYTVTASVSSVGGNSGSTTHTLTIDTISPVVVVPPTVATSDPTPAITGSGATPGATVTVVVAGQTMTTTVAADGAWSVTPPIALPPGEHAVTVTISDQAGNTGTDTQTLTITTAAPPTTNPPITPTIDEYTSVGPKRVFDTRAGVSPNALRTVPAGQVSGGYELQVKMTDLAGYVPTADVGAVSLNVTATGSVADGFITVHPCGTRELVSSVNYLAGATVANAVIAPVSATGHVCFYASAPTDIVVDINGWFAAGTAFHAVGPKRVFDTRTDNSPDAMRDVPKVKLEADTMLEVRVTDLAGYVPADDVGSVSLNVVVTAPEAPGFVTVYACATRELVSSVNFAAGQTVANAVIAPVSPTGTVCFYTLATTDLVVDINGWIEAGSSFHALDPARVLDTRPGQSPDAIRDVTEAKIGGGNILTVQVSDLPGYTPTAGVTAVSLNVTATSTEGAGYITVFACGQREDVSSLNYAHGATVANAVLAPVSAAGMICLYSSQRTDVVVDINGWIS